MDTHKANSRSLGEKTSKSIVTLKADKGLLTRVPVVDNLK